MHNEDSFEFEKFDAIALQEKMFFISCLYSQIDTFEECDGKN